MWYVVHTETGKVLTIVRDDANPLCCPKGYRLVPEKDMPGGWEKELATTPTKEALPIEERLRRIEDQLGL